MKQKKDKFIYILFAGLAVLLHGTVGAKEASGRQESFLFVGNSFTFRHDLKSVFKSLAEEGFPGKSLFVDMVVYGGRDLFRHHDLFKSQNLLCLQSLSDDDLRLSISEMQLLAAPGTERPGFYTDYWRNMDLAEVKSWEEYEAKSDENKPREKTAVQKSASRWADDQGIIQRAVENHELWIKNRSSYPAWDYVVLQSWQDVKDDSGTGYVKYATRFAELAKKQNTKVILYITASYSQNSGPVEAPLEKARALHETRIAYELAKKTDAIVVPVPLAIYLLQKNGTDLTLRFKTDGHPNQCGAYLTACLFYASVYGKSPEGLTLSHVTETKIVDKKKPDCDPDGGPLTRVFSDAERALMQRIAWEAAESFRSGSFLNELD
jgi:hypothetical protein